MSAEKQLVEIYLRDIGQASSLTDEEAKQLIQSRATALQRVVQAHLHLVVPIAEEYIGQGRALIDLILQGNIGLVRSVETFDTTTQEPFSLYATRAIRAAIALNQEGAQ